MDIVDKKAFSRGKQILFMYMYCRTNQEVLHTVVDIKDFAVHTANLIAIAKEQSKSTCSY